MFNACLKFAAGQCCCVSVLLVSNIVHAETPDSDIPTSTNAVSVTLTNHETGSFVLEQVLRPAGSRLQSLADSRLIFPRDPRTSRSYAPLRQMTFLGGDRILAEIVGWQDDQIELRLRNGQTVAVPRSSIESVEVPAGEIELIYDSFELADAANVRPSPRVERPAIDVAWLDRRRSASGRSSVNLSAVSRPLVFTLPDPLSSFRAQLWFLIDSAGDLRNLNGDLKTIPTELSLNLEFQSDNQRSLWKLNVTSSGISFSDHGPSKVPTTESAIALSRGWHCLTLASLVDRTICVVDDRTLVASVRSTGPLKSLQVEGTEGAWIDDLQISEINSNVDKVAIQPSTQDDCVALNNGDQWLGRVTQATSELVLLAGPAGIRQAAWHQVDRIALRQSDRSDSKLATSKGLWAEIEFQSILDRPHLRSEKILGAITAVNRDFLIVAHPWLGKIAIGWTQIARIQPRFFGEVIIVDPRRLHLGDAIRQDFQRPVPDGTDWSGEFLIPQLPPLSEIWLSMDAVDLQPSGPGTPPASPFLKELRSGVLVTQLSINDHAAGDLNRWTHVRGNPERPDHLRCRLPVALLQSGRNVIRLRQIPLQESGTGHDNCELSNLRIEIIESVFER